MKETLLLRICQAGLVVGGILFILIGIGVHTPWLRPLALLTVFAAIAGLVYECRLLGRGESDGLVAMMLPIAGVLSGAFALFNQLS